GASVHAAAPEGRIVFVRYGPDDNGRIYVINPDGSSLRRLRMRTSVKLQCIGENGCSTTIDWSYPAWSPDDRRLAAVGYFSNGLNGGDTRVYVRQPDGRTRAVFVSDAGTGTVTWSPDGKWLAHDSGRDCPTPLLIRVSTGKAHPVNKRL